MKKKLEFLEKEKFPVMYNSLDINNIHTSTINGRMSFVKAYNSSYCLSKEIKKKISKI